MNSNKNTDNEMSMEDILSSIRKYVSEDKEPEKQENDESGIKAPESEEDEVITLGADQLVEDKQGIEIKGQKPKEDTAVYAERSTLSASVSPIENGKTPRKPSPFEQLTNALNAYGRNKKTNTVGAKTVEQLFSEIATQIIQAWVDNKMEAFVEKIIMREIERIKSE